MKSIKLAVFTSVLLFCTPLPTLALEVCNQTKSDISVAFAGQKKLYNGVGWDGIRYSVGWFTISPKECVSPPPIDFGEHRNPRDTGKLNVYYAQGSAIWSGVGGEEYCIRQFKRFVYDEEMMRSNRYSYEKKCELLGGKIVKFSAVSGSGLVNLTNN